MEKEKEQWQEKLMNIDLVDSVHSPTDRTLHKCERMFKDAEWVLRKLIVNPLVLYLLRLLQRSFSIFTKNGKLHSF